MAQSIGDPVVGVILVIAVLIIVHRTITANTRKRDGCIGWTIRGFGTG